MSRGRLKLQSLILPMRSLIFLIAITLPILAAEPEFSLTADLQSQPNIP